MMFINVSTVRAYRYSIPPLLFYDFLSGKDFIREKNDFIWCIIFYSKIFVIFYSINIIKIFNMLKYSILKVSKKCNKVYRDRKYIQ